MCDYSLDVPSRLAEESDRLVTQPLGHMGCIGFAAQGEMPAKKAVCVSPGTRLALSAIPASIQQKLGVGPEEDVVFDQKPPAPATYRDGVRFKNKPDIVLLRELGAGVQAQVVELGDGKDDDGHEGADQAKTAMATTAAAFAWAGVRRRSRR